EGVLISCMEEQHSVPECIIPNKKRYIRNLFAPLQKQASEGFIKPDKCKKCKYFEDCPGMKKFYARIYGIDEINPVI
ncbi:MAG: hypothetical protein AB1546_05710, partial [bacterium]